MSTLLLDADVPDPVFQALAALKVPCVRVRDLQPGAGDLEVLRWAKELDAILITLYHGPAGEPLKTALAEGGARVVSLRPGDAPGGPEGLVLLVLRDRHRWEELFQRGAGVVTCTPQGSRIGRSKGSTPPSPR